MLSIPTKEYFQSSGWVDTSVPPPSTNPVTSTSAGASATSVDAGRPVENESVRTGSGFWAMGHHTESSSEFTAGVLLSPSTTDSQSPVNSPRAVGGGLPSRLAPAPLQQRRGQQRRRGQQHAGVSSDSSDSDGTQIAPGAAARRTGATMRQDNTRGTAGSHERKEEQDNSNSAVVDEVGAQDAFIAGMIYALSRRIAPGEPYTPSAVSRDGNTVVVHGAEADRERDRGRWRLEECLRCVNTFLFVLLSVGGN